MSITATTIGRGPGARVPPEVDVVGDVSQQGTLTASSVGLGWQFANVSSWVDFTDADGARTAAPDRHHIVLVTRGRRVMERRHGAAWLQTFHGPGTLSVRAAGSRGEVRWGPRGRDPVHTVHVQLHAALIDEAQHDFGSDRAQPVVDVDQLDDIEVLGVMRDLDWAMINRAPAVFADAAARLLAARLVTSSGMTTSPQRRRGGLAAPVLQRVVDFMITHLDQSVTLDDLSRVAHLSKHHLLRQFRVSTGMTPHRYLQRLRMQRAAEVLLRTGPTIRSVAQTCGYTSESHFATAFAQYAGASPSRYRAMHGVVDGPRGRG